MLGYCIRVWVIVENNLRYNIASKFVWSNSIARAVLHIPILHTHDVSKQISREKFSFGLKCYKTIGSYVSCAFIEIWSTWEVWRALKKLEHLSCSPNFPRASYLDERTLTYEPIVKYNSLLAVFLSVVFRNFTLLFFFSYQKEQRWYVESCLELTDLILPTDHCRCASHGNWINILLFSRNTGHSHIWYYGKSINNT